MSGEQPHLAWSFRCVLRRVAVKHLPAMPLALGCRAARKGHALLSTAGGLIPGLLPLTAGDNGLPAHLDASGRGKSEC